MKKIKFILIATISIFIAASCKEKIDLNLNNEEFSRLVVEGAITDENIQQTIKLTKTSDYSKPQPPIPATGAIVNVVEGLNTYLFNEVSPGVYCSKSILKGEINKTYTLNINFDNKDYTASSSMQPPLLLDSLYSLPATENGYYELYVNTQESTTPKQFYLLKTIKNGMLNDTIKNWSYFSDDLINGIYLQDLYIGYVNAKSGDTIQMKTFSISKEQYEYINTAMQTQSAPIPFLGSNPANIKGNISNGAMGFFQVSAVSLKGCIIQ